MSLPAILAQLTTIAMQYIDAGMVGSLGAEATASIGLVSSTTWLIGGSCIGISAGFYVQIAQLIGAGRDREAEDVLRQGLKTAVVLGILISTVCMLISDSVPRWLGGEEAILGNATAYFRIYTLAVPFVLLRQLSNGTMQSTGDMKTPSILSAVVCFLDVVLNMLMIFPARTTAVFGVPIVIPGAGLKVVGAALATTLSEIIISLVALYMLGTKNKRISLTTKGSWKWNGRNILTAAKIGIPLSFDQIFMCSAYVAGTKIVAGLGTVAIAANSLAITAESLCYMPGYGIGAAATAIIGQTIGAGRRDLTKSFSRVSVYLGMVTHGADRRDHVCVRADRVLAVDKQRGSGGARNGSAAARTGRGTALRRFNLLRGRFPGSGGYTAAEHHEFGQHVVCTNFDGAVSGSPHGFARILDGDGLGAVFSRLDFSGSALPGRVDEKGDGVTVGGDLWGGLTSGVP